MQEIFELCKKHNITYNDSMNDNTITSLLMNHFNKNKNKYYEEDEYDMKKFVNKCMDKYITDIKFIKDLIKDFKYPKNIRTPNFPEHISESIICLTLRKHLPLINPEKYKNKNSKDICFIPTTGGDLHSNIDGKLECKCFASIGPISFGPTEEWNKLYILNATSVDKNKFILYEINMNNIDLVLLKLIKQKHLL